MKGKLDITAYGLSDAFIHGLKVIGWHFLSYAIIVGGAEISGHLPTIINLFHGRAEYIPLIAAALNAVLSSAKVWLTSHAPAESLVMPQDGNTPSGFTAA